MKKLMILGVALLAGTLVAEEAKAPPAPAAQPTVQTLKKAGPEKRNALRRFQQGPRKRFGREFGKLADGRVARLYTIQGLGGLRLDVTDLGGRLVRCYAPDRYGNLADVTLGWNTPEEYVKNGFSMGTLIGRFGNRIKDGKFTLEGKECQLDINEDKGPRHNNIHGGPQGWDAKIWTVKPVRRDPVRGLELTLDSPDGDQKFPGNVKCRVTYLVHPNNTWSIDYEATTDKPTVINPTHHTYWNMAGEASGSIAGQELQIFADEYTRVDAGLIPVKNVPVKGTVFDFTTLRKIGAHEAEMAKLDELKPMDGWYDHNFVLRGKTGEMKPAATMRDPVSGRKLEVFTTEPGMQIYCAQNMDGTLNAKQIGAKYVKNAGIALETQHFPDSPNHPDFPSTVLLPGRPFKSRTEYRFTAE